MFFRKRPIPKRSQKHAKMLPKNDPKIKLKISWKMTRKA
jgi:hypothetical protein